MAKLLIFVLLFAVFVTVNGQLSHDLSAVKLKDIKNKTTSIDSGEKNTVILFLGTDCPITQKYISRIREIVEEFKPTTAFYGVFPMQFSVKEVKAFKKEYQIEFTLLSDDEMALAKHLGATVTPEVFLLDKDLHLQYQGAIDNWFYELGKSRLNTTENYLIDALSAVAKGKTPSISKTEAIGCFIEMPRDMMMDHQNHP
ncbi:MAG TPA: redoxin domain-containing protein [Cyclobacteriaceae bacterium]